MSDRAIRVSFRGRDLVWLREPDGSGALAPPDHVDEAGNVTLAAGLGGLSWAHVAADGTIWRYNQPIGHRDELVLLDIEGEAV